MNHRSPSRTTRSTPSPPMPARRSQRARTRSAERSPCTEPSWSGSRTKSFSVPCPLRNAYSAESGMARPVEALGVVVVGVVGVELFQAHPARLGHLRDHGAARHRRVGVPGLRLPETGAEERLRTVEEDLLD